MKLLPIFSLVIASIFFSACSPNPSPAQPAANVDALATAIAATIQALPSNTPWPTYTPSVSPTRLPPTDFPTSTLPPTIRPLSSLTSEPTITPSISPTIDGGSELNKPQGDANYGCHVLGQRPEDWTIFNPGQTVSVVWRISNVGAKDWTQDTVVLQYIDGVKIAVYGQKQQLLSPVKAGGVATVVLVIKVPEKKASDKPGNYLVSTWGLARGSKIFCKFAFQLTVK